MHYAIDVCNGTNELHVFKSKRDRDYYVTERLFRLGDVTGRRDATAAEAKSCNPWSMVLHDFGLGELATLPSWAYQLASKTTTWFGHAGDLHFCLV